MSQCVSHIFTHLHILVNSFINTLLNSRDYKAAVGSWSIIQALVSKADETNLIVLQIGVTLTKSACTLRLATMLSEVSNKSVPDDCLAKARTHDMYTNIMAYLNLILVTAYSL